MGIPFPIPKTGTELIWNHKLRHTGYKFRRFNAARRLKRAVHVVIACQRFALAGQRALPPDCADS